VSALEYRAPEWLVAPSSPVEVTVVGAGGTGSHFLDALASLDFVLRKQTHPGLHVRVYDDDAVSEFNAGRSRFSPADVGLNKAAILIHRLNAFYGIEWEAHPRRVDPADLGRERLLVTCVDSGAFRADLGAEAHSWRDTLWLDMGNGADTANCILGHLGGTHNDPLRLPNVYDLYGAAALRAGDADDTPSCSMEEALRRQSLPINRMVATWGMTLLHELIAHGSLAYHGLFISLSGVQVSRLQIDPDVWAAYGHVHSDCPA
jgi:PRTRC genetic system ThiF family protein